MKPASSSRPPERVAPPDADRILAAEYVLGTLDNDDRRRVRARCAADPQFAALVRLWERRLAPLHELAVPVIPSPDIWRAIASDLRSAPPALRGATLPRGMSPSPDPPRRPALPEGRPLRSAAGTGEGAVSRMRRLFGLGRNAEQSRPEPSHAAERTSRRRSFPPLDPVPTPTPGRPAVGPFREMQPAALLPQATSQGAALAPPRPALAPATRLQEPAAPLQLAPPPPRPRPAPEPLTPPPAFMFLEPDTPPEPEPVAEPPPAPEGEVAPAAQIEPAVEPPAGAVPVSSVPASAGEGEVSSPSEPAAAARDETIPDPPVIDPAAGRGEKAETGFVTEPAPVAEVSAHPENVLSPPSAAPAEADAEPVATEVVAAREKVEAQADGLPLDGPEALVSSPADALDAPSPDAAPVELPSSEAPSADPAAGDKGEEAPLPGWAAEVASGEVSALPDEPNAPVRVVLRHGPWRGISLLLALLCLGLGGVAAYREWVWPGEGYWVAVMQPEPLPAVSVRIDPDSGAVHVRSFAPAPPDGETYRLWLVSATSSARLIGAFSAGLSERVPELGLLGRKGLAGAQLVVTREPLNWPDISKGPGEVVVYRGRLVPE